MTKTRSRLRLASSILGAIASIGVLIVIGQPANAELDSDGDGLMDAKETAMGTNPNDPDTDHDGYADKVEIKNGYDPLDPRAKKAKKSIRVRLSKQKLSRFLGKTRLDTLTISSGRWNLPTPTGSFRIINKHPRAWSKQYGLYMPYWMGFAGGAFGIHELPEWPNGYKEGASHLGTPVSHGCIRLGVGDAKRVYSWTPTGTDLIIKK